MNDKKDFDKRELFAIIMMGFLFVIIYGFSLFLTGTFEEAGMQAFENPDDPANIAYIFVIMLGFTAIILLIAKYYKKQLIQVLIIGAMAYTSAYVFFPIFGLIFSGLLPVVFSILCAAILVIILYKYPEWYVLDVCGIIVGTGAIVIFGISLGVFLVLVLLVGLAVYDAISVYKTKHMVDLADTVMDLKLPVLLVMPKVRHYSLLKETKGLKEKLKEGEERDAFFMGLGDIVMPGILVVAVYSNVENAFPLAVSIIIGTLVGFAILMTFVIKGKPQAGLPCLCGGAILGYILSSLYFSGELVGLVLPVI